MANIEWSEKYWTGIAEIDRQHKTLVDLINIMDQVCHRAVNSEAERRIMMDKVIQQLVAYTLNHFSYEENLMKESLYPKFIEHKKSHETMIHAIQKYKSQYEKNNLNPEALLEFLSSWLLNHIMKSDQDYAPYVQKLPNLNEKKSAS